MDSFKRRYITVALCSALFSISTFSFSQSVGIGTTAPDPLAIMDIVVPDTTGNPQGLLLPRLWASNITTLSGSLGAAQEGMIVYDLDSGCIHMWDGSAWDACGGSGPSSSSPFTLMLGVVSDGNGDYTNDDFVFGSPQLNYDLDANHNSRFFFDKDRYAFRAGSVFDTSWDTDSLGQASVAFGDNNRATGYGDVAMGTNSIARGGSSVAIGDMCIATGMNSVAMGRMSEAHGTGSIGMGHFAYANGSESIALGFFNNANGFGSTALGQNSVANGDGALAIGNNISAESYNETALGMYNTPYVPNSTNSFDAVDRLFVIGNGQSGAESDGMVMLKNGNTIFGGSTPLGPFHVSVDKDAVNDSLFMVDDGGNVGVGVVPSGTYKIEIAGNIGTAGINEMSDKRWKKNISPLNNSLFKILQLEGVTYDWRTSEYPERNFESSRQIGFIAQEVEKVLPELVDEDANGYKSVEYSKLVSVLTEAVKEQQKQIDSQQQQIDYLKAEIDAIHSELGNGTEAKK